MVDIPKEFVKEEHRIEKSFKKSGINLWMIISAVLVVVIIVMAVWPRAGVLSGQQAGDKFVSFINDNYGSGIIFKSASDQGSLYEINVTFNGNEVPVYVTKDGKYFVEPAYLTPIVSKTASSSSSTPAPTNVPKTDRPKVELYIWSYCPYGVAAQGPMADVANLLKNSADFESVLYYAGHGEHEVEQNKIQACLQKYAKNKYWDYAKSFVANIYPECSSTRTIDCDKNNSLSLMKSLGIDYTSVMACVDSQGEALTQEYAARAGTNNVQGSPTIIINGVNVNVARDADSIKNVVCNSFTTAPAECSQTLSSTAATPSFGSGSSTAASAASCG